MSAISSFRGLAKLGRYGSIADMPSSDGVKIKS